MRNKMKSESDYQNWLLNVFKYSITKFNAQSLFVKACAVMLVLMVVFGIPSLFVAKGALRDTLVSISCFLFIGGAAGIVYACQNYQWVIGGDYLCPFCYKIEGKVIEKVDVLERTSTDVNTKVNNNIRDKDGNVVGTVEQMAQMKFIMATEKHYCKCNGCGQEWNEEVKRNYYE